MGAHPIADWLHEVLPPGFTVATDDPRREEQGLWPAEEAAIAQAIPTRRREFSAGRRAARAALRALGFADVAIPVGPDRAPTWPDGLCGSISHDDNLCFAAVGRTGAACSIGIDVEPAVGLPRDVAALVCRAEAGWLSGLPDAQADMWSRVIFSAKESFFKAQFPLTGAWIGFEAVAAEPSGDDLILCPVQEFGHFTRGTQVKCHCRVGDGQIATAVILT